MNNEDQIDNIIMNLKIIGMVQKNGRLCVRKGSLTLEHDDHLQTIRRWFNKDTRDLTMMHIRSTIMNAIKLTKEIMMKKSEFDIEFKKNIQESESIKDWRLIRILTEFNNCQTGLKNLKTTYNSDSIMIANIDVLLERLVENCKELEKNNI